MSDRTADWETYLGYGPAARALYYVIPALLGAGLGVGLHFLLDWLLSLPWLPFQGPLSLLDSIPDQVALPILIGLGVVAGVIFGAVAWADELSITVDGSRVRLTRGDSDHVINRTAVAAVFMDGKQLVLLGPDTGELAREKTDRPVSKIAEAFTRHGYPWRADGDPHADAFRLWSSTSPGLPPGTGALLSMRARALKNNKNEDAADLRAELLNLGVVVRDQGGKQYWRPVGPDQLEA